MLKKIMAPTLALLIYVSTPNAMAQMFQWVDEAGVTHFGDQVPLKYQNSAEEMNVQVHQPSTADLQAAEARRAQENAAAAAVGNNGGSTAIPNTGSRPDIPANASKCQKDWAEYRSSRDCFAKFRANNGVLQNGAFSSCKEVAEPANKC